MDEFSTNDEGGAERTGSQSGVFEALLKQRARKILMDYSLLTGRKCQAIRNEVVALAAPHATDDAPIITRQDLESWFRGSSVIGDAKFQVVFNFLTNAETLQREEFRAAKFLMDSRSEAIHAGGYLSRFYGIKADRRKTLPTDPSPRNENGTVAPGLYINDGRPLKIVLSVNSVDNSDFMIAHALFMLGGGNGSDWNTIRLSGFLTVGQKSVLHLKDLRNGHSYLAEFSFGMMRYAVESLKRVSSDRPPDASFLIISRYGNLNEFLVPDDGNPYRMLGVRGSHSSAFLFKKIEDTNIDKFIDNFRWSVPL